MWQYLKFSTPSLCERKRNRHQTCNTRDHKALNPFNSIFFYCLSYEIYAAHCLQIFDIYKHVNTSTIFIKFKWKIPTISHIKRLLFLLSEYRTQLIKKITKILYYIQQEISRVITLKNWARCSKIFVNGYRMSEFRYYSLIQISLLSSEI